MDNHAHNDRDREIIVVGLNHVSAPVEIREQFAMQPAKIPQHLEQLKAGTIKEAVILSTCNRVEIYALAQEPGKGIEQIYKFLQSIHPAGHLDRSYFYHHQGTPTVQHLFEVTCGLNSMVMGETEVTGQVKEAYRIALESGSTCAALNKLFQRAFHAAKAIRSNTKIGSGSVSVGSVAADLAVQIFGNLHDKRVLLLGAGNMSATTARALNARGCRSIIVSNRLHDRAVELARELNGQAAHFEEWPKKFLEADIMIASTAAPHHVVSKEVLAILMAERDYRPIFLIDIAVPRDIERTAGEIENVYLYDIDDLKVIADQNLALRQQELIQCRDKIHSLVEKFTVWFHDNSTRNDAPPESTAALQRHAQAP